MTCSAREFLGWVEPGDPRWDAALAKVTHDFWHLPGYLQASARNDGGEPLLFLLDAGDHGMLVPLIKRPLAGFGAAYADHFDVTSPYGYPAPLFWGERWPALLAEMFGRFEAFLRECKVVSVFLRLNPFVGAQAEQLAALGRIKTHGPTIFMDLRDPAGTWKGMSRGNQEFIKRMLHRGYAARIDQWETLDTVIEAYHETMRRLEASPYYLFPKEFFERLRAATAPHLHLSTTYAPDGAITGGVVFSEVGGLIHYYLVGYFGLYGEVSPSKLSINAIRLWGLERGHHTLNLGGGLGACRDGLFQFKARLARMEGEFSTFHKVLLPEPYQALCGGVIRICGTYFPCYRCKAEREPDGTCLAWQP